MSAWLALLLAAVLPAPAGTRALDVPDAVDTSRVYLIYLHGRIVEDAGPRPTDARFGLYDYPAILDALASRGAQVILAKRKPGTEVNAYADVVVAQVDRLIQAGAPPGKIVVAGFSKGGDIAIHASSLMKRPEVRFVLLAACWDRPDQLSLRLTGRVFSVHETSDELAGSCRPLADVAEPPQSFEELTISTGKAHGTFYLPLAAWVDPVLDWVHGQPLETAHAMRSQSSTSAAE